jgi:hypothetical protein
VTTGLLAPLRLPQFRRLWAGQTLSSIGDGVMPVVLAGSILAHHGASELGLVLGGESLALVLVVLFGGVLADRIRRTRAMIVADLLRMGAVTGFALGATSGMLALPVALAMLAGLGSGLFVPASRALLPAVVPDLLTQANALQSLSTRIGLIVGPALGGVFLATAGPAVGFWFDAATFLASVLSLLTIADAKPVRERAESVLSAARAGIRAVLDRPWVATIIGQGTIQLIFAMAPAVVLLPIYLHEHGELSAYGLMLVLQACGSATGGVLVGSRTPQKPGTVGVLGLGLLTLQLLCIVCNAPLAWLGAAMFLTGFGYALFGVLWATGLQRSIPDDLLGRVFAVETLGTYSLEPAGLALAPIAAQQFGLRPILITAILVMAATTVVPFLVSGVAEFAGPPLAGHSAPTARAKAL